MRVFSVLICPVIISVVIFSESDITLAFSDPEVELVQAAEPEVASLALFRRKKKRMKNSGRMKRHNKSMGKGFKRKNDDTMRRGE